MDPKQGEAGSCLVVVEKNREGLSFGKPEPKMGMHADRARFSDMAKVFSTNTAMEVTTQCVQVMGSYGYSKEYPVEKYMRDAKIVQIFLGPNELLSQLIGASL